MTYKRAEQEQAFPFLSQEFLHNTVYQYLFALLLFLAGLLVIAIFKRIVLMQAKRLAEKTDTIWDDFIIEFIEKKITPYLALFNLYFCIKTLHMSESAHKFFDKLATVILSVFVIYVVSSAFSFLLADYLNRQDFKQGAKSGYKKALLPAIKIVIWIIGSIFILDNLGLNISSVVTGLGIGGVAVALAAQTVLKDLFSYFAIVFDRPFEIGDFIVVGEYSGTVEFIGIKTTRLRGPSGEQVVCSNSFLTDSRLKNLKRMTERRVNFKLNVELSTSLEKLQEIPVLIKEAILSLPKTRFDRSHIAQFSDFNVVVETVYFITNNDYNEYMDIQQEINFKIKKMFDERHIHFAYPTQKTIVSQSC